MAFVMLDDRTERLECSLFADIYDNYRDLLVGDPLLVAEGSLAIDSFSNTLRLTVEKLYDMAQAREAFSRGLLISWAVPDDRNRVADFIDELVSYLQPYRGGGSTVSIQYVSAVAQATVQLGDEWRVRPSDELLHQLRLGLGEAAVQVRYG